MGPKTDKQDSSTEKLDLQLFEILDEINDLMDDLRETERIGQALGEGSNRSLFMARVTRLDATFDKFSSRVTQGSSLAHSLGKSDCRRELADFRKRARLAYYSALSVDLGSDRSAGPLVATNQESSSPIKLPTINLPTFDGTISKWVSFRDTYLSLIHNNRSLDPIQRFHYLKSSLSGVAAEAIAAFPITAQDYDDAWLAVLKRYDNKRLHASHFLSRIFSHKPIQRLSLSALETFSNVILESAFAFKRCDLKDPSGFILLSFALRLLDPRSRERFESHHLGKTEIPTLEDLQRFIHDQCILLQTDLSNCSEDGGSTGGNRRAPKRVLMSNYGPPKSDRCPIFDEKGHPLYRCAKFIALSPKIRFEKVKALRLCFNCLSAMHTSRACTSSNTCKHCERTHHTMLHFPTNNRENTSKNKARPSLASTPPDSSGSRPLQTEETNTILSSSEEGQPRVLLGTALVRIRAPDGRLHPIRMLVDSGSQRSFITSSAARSLGLKTIRNIQRLQGFANCPIKGGEKQTDCILVPRNSVEPEKKVTAIIIPTITTKVPTWPIPESVVRYCKRFELADPAFAKPGTIDFLLGAELFIDIMTGIKVTTPVGYPNVLKTIYGDILMGQLDAECSQIDGSVALLSATQPSPNLVDVVQKFWEIESIKVNTRHDPDDVMCEQHFCSTHSRTPEGRYVVRLPFQNPGSVRLGESYHAALVRFRKLEYKMERDILLQGEYSRTIRAYVEMGYVSAVTVKGRYYLPHHGVTRSGSNKVRIVFDASAKTVCGSLNDALRTGPKLQLDIRDIILNFRRYPCAFSTDITQMFLQVVLNPEDRKYLHFLFRFHPDDSISEYEFNRLPFGLSCSPFLANRVLRQLVSDEGAAYPLASEVLRNNIYVDDILAGGDSVESVVELQSQLITLLEKGGFQLKKWASNTHQILDNVVSDGDDPYVNFEDRSDPCSKLLGLGWDPKADVLSYKLNFEESRLQCSKRGVLSIIARMYDPLGYLAPVVFKAKLVLQRLWALKIDWDAPLPSTLEAEWVHLVSDLNRLSEIRIPRCIFPREIECTTIVGFTDASMLGYAAVVYLRNQYVNGEVEIHLIVAKSRLAPLKTISIPKLELCAALLLVQTIKASSNVLDKILIHGKYLFSDSTIVLNWLQMLPSRLKTFVANRVTMVLEDSKKGDWNHILSGDNPADLATRGLMPHELVTHVLWWKGPSWMRNDIRSWLIQHTPTLSTIPEIRKSQVMLMRHPPPNELVELTERYSSYSRLTRVVALLYRFINLTRGASQSGPLSVKEIKRATMTLIRATQNHYFSTEQLASKFRNTSLYGLSPYEDSDGILRVRGRLAHAPISEESKHPIILPQKAHLTYLIIDHYHKCHLHAGPNLTHSLLQRRFWVVTARRVIRSRIHQCLTCRRIRVKTFTPMMADLPPSRFEQGRAFLRTGVDFAGPFLIKTSPRRNSTMTKCYICLFICMSTKAIHLEVVSDLTSVAFMASLDRFIARRGIPTVIMSDHGTNFVGASRTLKDLYRWLKNKDTQREISDHLMSKEIHWQFIPPAAPHFGGLWEAGVKSVKHHLNRTLDGRPFSFEELSTICARIEAILNSRPLYPLSQSPDEYDTLTPSHFLTGGPLVTLPQIDFTEGPSNRLNRWQLLHRCIQNIWSRWRFDYLNSLQQRAKWREVTPNVRIGTLVLLKDRSAPPQSWPTGRVIRTHPGPDGIVRVVTLRTAKGELMRAVTPIAPLLPTEE